MKLFTKGLHKAPKNPLARREKLGKTRGQNTSLNDERNAYRNVHSMTKMCFSKLRIDEFNDDISTVTSVSDEEGVDIAVHQY